MWVLLQVVLGVEVLLWYWVRRGLKKPVLKKLLVPWIPKHLVQWQLRRRRSLRLIMVMRVVVVIVLAVCVLATRRSSLRAKYLLGRP
jgi:hypothetical protein